MSRGGKDSHHKATRILAGYGVNGAVIRLDCCETLVIILAGLQPCKVVGTTSSWTVLSHFISACLAFRVYNLFLQRVRIPWVMRELMQRAELWCGLIYGTVLGRAMSINRRLFLTG